MNQKEEDIIAKVRRIAEQRNCMPLAYSDISSVEAFSEVVLAFCEYAETLREENGVFRKAADLLQVDREYAHRLAVMLECALLDKTRCWDEACRTLGEYRAAVNAIEPPPETNIWGEPLGMSDLPSNYR